MAPSDQLAAAFLKQLAHEERVRLKLDVSYGREIAGGYGEPGIVPMPWSAPEFDHDGLKPIAYDLELSRQYMEKAGYKF